MANFSRDDFVAKNKEFAYRKSRVQYLHDNIEPDALPKVVWDASQIKLEQLMNNINNSINSPNYSSLELKFDQVLGLELDAAKLIILKNEILATAAINKEFLQLQADQVFSFEYLKNRIVLNNIASQHEKEIFLEEHLSKITKLKEDSNSLELDNKLKKAQLRKFLAEARREEEINKYFKKIQKLVKIENFSEAFITYILTSFLKVDGSKIDELDIMSKLNEFKVEIGKAQAEKAVVEVDGLKEDVSQKKWKNRRTQKDADEV